MQNNFNNNEYMQKMQKMFSNPQAFKTKQSLKYAISILLGLIPMIGAWVFLRADGDVVFEGGKLFVEGINYGMMWGIAVGMVAFSAIGTWVFIKFNKDIKADVFVPTVTLSIFMSAFYLLPLLDLWVRMFASFGFFLMGGLISRMILMAFIVYKMQEQYKKMKTENPEMFKNMQNPFGGQQGQGGNNPFNQGGSNPFAGKSEDNPYGYTDQPDSSKTSEYDEDEKED